MTSTPGCAEPRPDEYPSHQRNEPEAYIKRFWIVGDTEGKRGRILEDPMFYENVGVSLVSPAKGGLGEVRMVSCVLDENEVSRRALTIPQN